MSAFPLAPLFALFNNVFELRLDAKKLLVHHRRPVAQRGRVAGMTTAGGFLGQFLSPMVSQPGADAWGYPGAFLGGAVLLAKGLVAGRTWYRSAGPATTAGLSVLYLAGFGLSHPLAKRMGAWPSVFTVAAVNGAASWALVDRHNFRSDAS